MKVSQMIEILSDLGADDDIFCYFFTKDEADTMASEDLEDDFRFEGSHWAKIVEQLESDGSISQEADEAFRAYVEHMIQKVQNETN